VHLAILCHSPFHARHSPGKLHVLKLGAELANEGFEALDLTPGGDAWKERFANTHDTVYELLVHPGRVSRAVALGSARGLAWGRWALGLVGGNPGQLKRVVKGLWRSSRSAAKLDPEEGLLEPAPRVYRCEAARLANREGWTWGVNHLPDLLACADPDRMAFLSKALERLESGWSVYTCLRNDMLYAVGWSSATATGAPEDAASAGGAPVVRDIELFRRNDDDEWLNLTASLLSEVARHTRVADIHLVATSRRIASVAERLGLIPVDT
jgi:hypothetical protein